MADFCAALSSSSTVLTVPTVPLLAHAAICAQSVNIIADMPAVQDHVQDRTILLPPRRRKRPDGDGGPVFDEVPDSYFNDSTSRRFVTSVGHQLTRGATYATGA